MGRKVRLLYVLTAAFVIAATGLMVMTRLDGEIAVQEDIARETRLYQLEVNAVNSDYTREIAMQNTSTYIMNLAQEYGYLSPGQIRFTVVNREALGLSDQEDQTGTVIDAEDTQDQDLPADADAAAAETEAAE